MIGTDRRLTRSLVRGQRSDCGGASPEPRRWSGSQGNWAEKCPNWEKEVAGYLGKRTELPLIDSVLQCKICYINVNLSVSRIILHATVGA